MSNIQGASFCLRTSSLPSFASGANATGSTNNAQASSFTWNNIDLRSILGDLYDKYDYFNISLVNALHTVATATPAYPSADNRMGIINMTGLRWTSSYDTGTKSIVASQPMGFVNFSTWALTVASLSQYNSLGYCTFTKSNPSPTITLYYTRVSDNVANTINTGTLLFPQSCFMFRITPIPKEEISFGSRRLF